MAREPSLITELEDAMASRSDDKRTEALRKVTDLFVGSAPSYSNEQVELFDNVIGRLAESSDVPAKAELSERLARIENAPINVVRKLAADDAIDVAAPVLKNSSRLSEAQLADLAATKGRRHLLAIADRQDLGEQVTDALLTHGDQQVARSVAFNTSARVSEQGYDTLADIAAKDVSLVESLVQRRDIPQRHFRMLVAVAPEPVQRRLAATNPRLAERIRQAIVEGKRKAARPVHHDYSRAEQFIAVLVNAGKLGDETVQEIARSGQFEESVVALAALAELSINAANRLFTSEPPDTVLIAARAVGLSWPTAKALLILRNSGRNASPGDLEDAKLNFVRLGPATAKQGLQRFKARVTPS